MRLSVALCTYNGGRFLAEQLASLRAQTRPPDEVVIFDDGSTDGTLALLRAFAIAYPFPLLIDSDPSTLGSTANFARAIKTCRGDVIALCDQDDVWLPHKLATLERVLNADPAAGFVFSDAAVVDENTRPFGHTLWDALEFPRSEQEQFRRGRAFERLLKRHRVTGAAMAFRSRFRDRILPIPPGWVHDAWIAFLISATTPCADRRTVIEVPPPPRPAGRGRQARAPRPMPRRVESGAATFAAVAERYTEALDRLRSIPDVPAGRLRSVEGKIEHARRRAAMRAPGTWRLPLVVRETRSGRYCRFSRGWKSVSQDLFLG